MSVTAFDDTYVPLDARPIHARPRGVAAAAAIGCSALTILIGALIFSPRASVPQRAAALDPSPPAESPAAPKIATQVRQGAADAAKPFASFDLDAPAFAHEKKTVGGGAVEDGAGREDNLTFGQFSGTGAYLRLDIRQTDGERLGPADFFVDIGKHVGTAGLVVSRISPPTPLATRFGAFEAADIRLSATAKGVDERSCLAVRLVNAPAYLEIAGLSCGAGAKPLDRREMGCLLDRLDYHSNGQNRALDEFFLNAELERGKGCPEGVAPAAAPRASMLDNHVTAPLPKAKHKQIAPAKHKDKPQHEAAGAAASR